MDGNVTDLLQQGIAAARAGQREQARDLLMRVVEQEERNVAAWLWLSGVVDGLDDREVCLENVLALDPQNQPACKGLDWIREQKAAAASVYTPPLISEMVASRATPPLTPAAAILRKPPSEPEIKPAPPAMPAYSPSAPLSPDDFTLPMPPASQEEVEAQLSEFDDEYLCPYCAEPTEPDDKTCPACHGKLWRYSRRIPEGSYWFWMLLGYLILTSLGKVYWMALSLSNSIGPMFARGQIQSFDQFVGLYVGLNTLPPEVAASVTRVLPPLVFWSFVISVSTQLGLALLVYLRWQPIYWLLVAGASINALVALAQVVLNYSLGAMLSLGVALVPVLILLLIQEDFMVNRERVLCTPDRDIHTHSAFYMRGREYARQKMWALAAIHYRRAAAGAPGMLVYHLALATAYTRLKRYDRAQSVLRGAQRLEPESSEVRELADLVAAARAQIQGAKRSTA